MKSYRYTIISILIVGAVSIGLFYQLGQVWARNDGAETSTAISHSGNVTLFTEPLTPENIQGHFSPQGILNFTNYYRIDHGLSPLVYSKELTESACLKAEDMVAKDYWSHNAPDGSSPWYFFNKVGYDYKKAGENLAYGQRHSQDVVDGWIVSPKHEANLVGEYTEMGVCTVYASDFNNHGFPTNVTVAHYGSR